MGDLGGILRSSGRDNRFGFRAEGYAPGFLWNLEKSMALMWKSFPKEMDGHRKISSTYIREELKKRKYGESHFPYGKGLFCGRHRWYMAGEWDRRFCFLTTNIRASQDQDPAAKRCVCDKLLFGDKIYHGITNIGCKPTVGESFIGWKHYLFDCKREDLYGEECRVDFKNIF